VFPQPHRQVRPGDVEGAMASGCGRGLPVPARSMVVHRARCRAQSTRISARPGLAGCRAIPIAERRQAENFTGQAVA